MLFAQLQKTAMTSPVLCSYCNYCSYCSYCNQYRRPRCLLAPQSNCTNPPNSTKIRITANGIFRVLKPREILHEKTAQKNSTEQKLSRFSRGFQHPINSVSYHRTNFIAKYYTNDYTNDITPPDCTYINHSTLHE